MWGEVLVKRSTHVLIISCHYLYAWSVLPQIPWWECATRFSKCWPNFMLQFYSKTCHFPHPKFIYFALKNLSSRNILTYGIVVCSRLDSSSSLSWTLSWISSWTSSYISNVMKIVRINWFESCHPHYIGKCWYLSNAPHFLSVYRLISITWNVR